MKFEHIKQNQAETVKNLEKEVIQESMSKSGVNVKLKRKLQAAILKLDKGENDECLSELCIVFI